MARSAITIGVALVLTGLLVCDQDSGLSQPTDDRTPDGTMQSVTSSGGTFDFPGGISLDVPAGALAATTQVGVVPVTSPRADSLVTQSGITDKRVLAVFDMRPANLAFLQPVTVTVPALPYSPGGLPYLFTLDTIAEACLPSITNLTADSSLGTVTVSVSGCSTFAVVEILGVLDSTALGKALDCRSGSISVAESARSSTSQQGTNQTCQVNKVDGAITYHSCAGAPTETWSFHEVSQACRPQLQITGPTEVSCGGSPFDVTVTLALASDPIPQSWLCLYTEYPSDATIAPQSGQTSSSGTLTATVTPGNKDVLVGVSADVTYVISYIAVSAGGAQESHTKTRLSTVRTAKTIMVNPRISAEASRATIGVDDRTEITVRVSCGEEQYSGTVRFRVAPACASLSAESDALSGNTARTTLYGDSEGTATVTATFEPSNGGSPVSATVDVVIGCMADSTLVAYSKALCDSINTAFRLGSRWRVQIEEDGSADSTCTHSCAVTDKCEDECSGVLEWHATALFEFTMPPPLQTLPCDVIELWSPAGTPLSQSKEMIRTEYRNRIDSLFSTVAWLDDGLTATETIGRQESGAYETNNWVATDCGDVTNPCSNTIHQFSGCSDTYSRQATRVVWLDWELGDPLPARFDASGGGEDPNYERPLTQTAQGNSFRWIPDGCHPVCDTATRIERSCFSAYVSPHADTVPLTAGTYPYDHTLGDPNKESVTGSVTVTCISGCP